MLTSFSPSLASSPSSFPRTPSRVFYRLLPPSCTSCDAFSSEWFMGVSPPRQSLIYSCVQPILIRHLLPRIALSLPFIRSSTDYYPFDRPFPTTHRLAFIIMTISRVLIGRRAERLRARQLDRAAALGKRLHRRGRPAHLAHGHFLHGRIHEGTSQSSSIHLYPTLILTGVFCRLRMLSRTLSPTRNWRTAGQACAKTPATPSSSARASRRCTSPLESRTSPRRSSSPTRSAWTSALLCRSSATSLGSRKVRTFVCALSMEAN